MKVFFLTLSALALTASPVAAADLSNAPRNVVVPAPVYVEPVRVYVPLPYCRIETERFFDGYLWRSRDIQVCR